MIYPTRLEQPQPSQLVIDWSDGQRRVYTVKQLRDDCPCATCREKRSAPTAAADSLLPVLTPAEARPLTITSMQPMGSYAYSIEFSDGHNTGIYTFEHLLSIK